MREDTRLVRTAHRDAFVEAWADFDPQANGRLRVAVLPALIRTLRPPTSYFLLPTSYLGRCCQHSSGLCGLRSGPTLVTIATA